MPERYPGYDVLAKRDTPSWNSATRAVVEARLNVTNTPRFLNSQEWQTLCAVCDCIVPQPKGRPSVPTAALVDRKLANDERDGYRAVSLPPLREAWRHGLAALDTSAETRDGRHFHLLPAVQQDELLGAMQAGTLDGPEWQDMPAQTFFRERLVHDIVAAYYSHPISWSEIGFGGPASPRGYVRMYFNRRDPWEAVEAKPREEAEARKANKSVG
jgi:hypothetical protein